MERHAVDPTTVDTTPSSVRMTRLRSLGRQGTLVVAIPLLALMVATGAALAADRQLGEALDAVERTLVIRNASTEMLGGLVDAETGVRGFALTGDAAYLEPYEDARRLVDADMETLRSLVIDGEFANCCAGSSRSRRPGSTSSTPSSWPRHVGARSTSRPSGSARR